MVEYLEVDKNKNAESENEAQSANADAGSGTGRRSSDDGEFNFEKELAEYNGMVKNMDLSNVQEGVKADLMITTLEGTIFKLDWSVS